jgi:N-glycosylase/DNA lyase
LNSEYLTKKAFERVGNFNVEERVLRIVKYIGDLVLLANNEAVLQGMSERLSEIGRCYGMAKNVEKTQVMRISSNHPSTNYDT